MIIINRRSRRCRLRLDTRSLRHSLRTIPTQRLLLALSGWVTMMGTLVLPSGSALRTMLVFGFVLVCPGFAVARLLPVGDLTERWVLAIALSTSVAILITVALTVLSIDSTTLRVGLLALITTLAVLIDLRICHGHLTRTSQTGQS